MNLRIRRLNFESSAAVNFIAKIHEEMQSLLDKDFKLENGVVQKRVEQILADRDNDNALYLVAEMPGEGIVAFHFLDIREVSGERFGHVRGLWVREDFRGKGIARQIKERGEEWARKRGASSLRTNVDLENKNMIEFNKKQGFKPLSVSMTKKL